MAGCPIVAVARFHSCWQYNDAVCVTSCWRSKVPSLPIGVCPDVEWYMQKSSTFVSSDSILLRFPSIKFYTASLKQRLRKRLGSREVFGRRFSEPSVRNRMRQERKKSQSNDVLWKLLLTPSRTLWGSWAQKSLCSVSCLEEIGFIQPPRPSLSSRGQVQMVANQGREEMQRKGRKN